MAEKYTLFKSPVAFPSRTLALLFNQIEQQKRVLQQLQAVLPEPLAKHVLHCVINDKKLLIYTGSAAWASQLRFYNKTILAAIAPITTRTVNIMQVKILLENSNNTGVSVRKANLPSSETIEMIRNQGAAVPDDQLKQALLSLSTTLKRLSD
ncbi:MAG: DciA family protein [Methylococcales bacterium]